MTAPMTRRRRERGPSPLSARTRRRLLRDLPRRAWAGDASAAESLMRLAERPAGAAATAVGKESGA